MVLAIDPINPSAFNLIHIYTSIENRHNDDSPDALLFPHLLLQRHRCLHELPRLQFHVRLSYHLHFATKERFELVGHTTKNVVNIKNTAFLNWYEVQKVVKKYSHPLGCLEPVVRLGITGIKISRTVLKVMLGVHRMLFWIMMVVLWMIIVTRPVDTTAAPSTVTWALPGSEFRPVVTRTVPVPRVPAVVIPFRFSISLKPPSIVECVFC